MRRTYEKPVNQLTLARPYLADVTPHISVVSETDHVMRTRTARARCAAVALDAPVYLTMPTVSEATLRPSRAHAAVGFINGGFPGPTALQRDKLKQSAVG